jgi:hypothetical protein
MASDDEYESESVSDDEYVSGIMILTSDQIRLSMGRRGPQPQSFNEYQSLSAKQKEAIRNGIRIGLFQAFRGMHTLPHCWLDAIFDFLLENISTAYSHRMIVKSLSDFCKHNYSSDDVSAPIIARYVISCTNRQLFLLATSKKRAKESDGEENSKKRAKESDGEENPEAQAAIAALFGGGRPRGSLVVRGGGVYFVKG